MFNFSLTFILVTKSLMLKEEASPKTSRETKRLIFMPDVVSSFQSMIRSGYDGLAIRHTSYTAKTTSVKIYQGQAGGLGQPAAISPLLFSWFWPTLACDNNQKLASLVPIRLPWSGSKNADCFKGKNWTFVWKRTRNYLGYCVRMLVVRPLNICEKPNKKWPQQMWSNVRRTTTMSSGLKSLCST